MKKKRKICICIYAIFFQKKVFIRREKFLKGINLSGMGYVREKFWYIFCTFHSIFIIHLFCKTLNAHSLKQYSGSGVFIVPNMYQKYCWNLWKSTYINKNVLIKYIFICFFTVTSTQSWLPAEFKHITKQRKRN